jgi:hypothetical protein
MTRASGLRTVSLRDAMPSEASNAGRLRAMRRRRRVRQARPGSPQPHMQCHHAHAPRQGRQKNERRCGESGQARVPITLCAHHRSATSWPRRSECLSPASFFDVVAKGIVHRQLSPSRWRPPDNWATRVRTRAMWWLQGKVVAWTAANRRR